MLNAYPSGAWQSNAGESALIEAFRRSSMHKYSKFNSATALELSQEDVLIMGQVTGDASWAESSCAVVDNIDLVRHAVADLPDARGVYYKPHPRNRRNRQELAEIEHLFKNVQIVDSKVNFKTLIAMRPTVVVNTSGTGLDAGLAGCEVHAYGCSFYAGWGATIDHHTMPQRRSNGLTFEDIFVVTNLHYSRHYHRHTGEKASAVDLVNEIRQQQTLN
jgi:capsular polysaccharide export protein